MSVSNPPLKLAKTSLGLPETAPPALVPPDYLNELKNHLIICPDDTMFSVTATPKYSFGKVTCLENGCTRVEIALQPNPNIADGGKNIGIGSLSAYRAHIAQHPTHGRNRLARLRAKSGAVSVSTSKKAKLVKKEPSLVDYHTTRNVDSAMASSSPDVQHRRTSYKRSSSPDIHVLSSLQPPSKKLKKESTPKAPLVTSTNTVGPSASSSTAILPAVDTSDTRSRIEDLQMEISRKQDLLDRTLRKRKLLAADRTRIKHYNDDLASLRLLRDNLKSSLPAMSPVKKTFSTLKIDPRYSSATAEAGPSRFPWSASSDVAPTVKREVHPFEALRASANLKWEPAPAPPMALRTNPEPIATRVPPAPQMNALVGPSNHKMPTAPGSILHNPFLDDDDDIRDSETVRANAIAAKYAGEYIPNVAPMMYNDDNYDADGNFHGRGRDHFQGPVARADDIQHFLVEAGNSETFDNNATVDQALQKLGLASLFAPLPGMEVALMPHQVIGVAWMVEKEKSFFKGGCLADEMGLGKTVQMIATMLNNPSQDEKCKTTLILAPTALLDQWKQELELKTNVDIKCLIYYGSSKPKRAKDLLKYDVVLTTFQTMATEWIDVEGEAKKAKKKAKAKKDNFIVSDDDSDDRKPKKKKENGLLFQVDFYRIVLDEAQNIRNKTTRISRAVTALSATYRWCLTGTPIVNSLLDTYGLIRFLRIRPWYDFQEFHPYISRLEKRNPQLAITRLQAILNTFMLRRKKDSKLDGKELIELPIKEIVLTRLDFTEEERQVYDAVETRMQARFNRYLRAGTVLKNYSTVILLLLRLRQCCVHPSLIQEEGVAFVAADELEDAGRVLKRARALVSDQFVRNLKLKFKEAALERMRAERESQDTTIEADDCPICFDQYTNPVITSCGHSFCDECIHDVFNTPLVEPVNEPARFKEHERPCPACRTPITKDLLFEQAAFMPTDEELEENGNQGDDSDIEMEDATASKSKANSTRKSKKKAKRIVIDSDDDSVIDVDADSDSEFEDDDNDLSDFIIQSDEEEEEKDARKALKKQLGKRKGNVVLDSEEEEQTDEEEKEIIFGKSKTKKLSPEAIKLLPKFLPSTKMKYMIEYMRQIFEERPNEKILVISQWTSCLSLVSQYLEEHDVLHVKYQGDMNRVKRDAAVRSFMSKDKARVMLLSLKCGGVGLNLTRANNVISLDLGWSQAIEAQAFDRVHRLGQRLPVKVERLVIENTVEDRVLAMQERKQALADGSLGEGNAKKISRMTVKQLAELFGLDGRGQLLPKAKGKDKTQDNEADGNAD